MVIYDVIGDMYYDIIFVFIKSVRGFDLDAVLFYLVKMFDSGEDIKFIVRRFIILAVEDIGLVDLMVFIIVVFAVMVCEFVGMFEVRIILVEVIIYFVCSLKSNFVYLVIEKVLEDVKNVSIKSIFMYFRMAVYGEEKFGYGIGYLYFYDYKNYWVLQ